MSSAGIEVKLENQWNSIVHKSNIPGVETSGVISKAKQEL